MSSLIYVRLDASYADDEKIILAGEEAELLYVRALCLVKRILSDGFVSDVQLARFALKNVSRRATKLCQVGLWTRDDEKGGYWITAWLNHNRTAAEVLEIIEKRRAAGSLGGKAGRKQQASRLAHQSAQHELDQVANHVSKPETETETETETHNGAVLSNLLRDNRQLRTLRRRQDWQTFADVVTEHEDLGETVINRGISRFFELVHAGYADTAKLLRTAIGRVATEAVAQPERSLHSVRPDPADCQHRFNDEGVCIRCLLEKEAS